MRRLLLSSAGLARLHRTESDMIGKAKNLTVQLTALDETAEAGNQNNNPRPETAGANSIGIAVIPVDAKTRTRLGLAAGEGVQIARVNNPIAAQAGLSAGDVILQMEYIVSYRADAVQE